MQCFDLDTIAIEKKAEQPKTLRDRLMAMYYQQTASDVHLGYATRGFKLDGKTGLAPEMMYMGSVVHDTKASRFIMRNPSMIIGTDRLELYEFIAQKR